MSPLNKLVVDFLSALIRKWL